MKKFMSLTGILVSILLLAGCSDNFTPKPHGYFRIALPETAYKKLDSIYPYTFEYPSYCEIQNDRMSPEEKNWINLFMPGFDGSIHFSYKTISNKENLAQYIEDSRAMVMKHIPKANDIQQIPISDPQGKVYGLVYNITGVNAASPYQFYVTDSTRHFLRGALYFNTLPNNDSLAPVIDFVKKDIEHLLNTLKWK